MLEQLTDQLRRAESLSGEQISHAVRQLTAETTAVEAKAEFLSALAAKGETAGEIAGFARELRERAIAPPIDAITRGRVILDVCGTGGDRLGTFNISTTVALICAAAGVTVAKHGNRAITSQAGSADVLEALGVKINASPDEAARSLRDHGFAFFFAPGYHPAFKHIAPARKLCAERGQRTIFNFLGPLLNPARPTAQLVGVPRPQLCEPVARVLQSLGVQRGMVVCGAVPPSPHGAISKAEPNADNGMVHLDELSTLGANQIAEFYHERGFAASTLMPESFPIQPALLADLAGGDRATNAEIVRNLLRGDERGPKRDAVLLNAAAALVVAGSARSFSSGWELAANVIDDGRALRKLESLIGN